MEVGAQFAGGQFSLLLLTTYMVSLLVIAEFSGAEFMNASALSSLCFV